MLEVFYGPIVGVLFGWCGSCFLTSDERSHPGLGYGSKLNSRANAQFIYFLFAYQPGRFGTGYVNEIFSSEKQLHLNCRIEPLLRMYNSPMNNKIIY